MQKIIDFDNYLKKQLKNPSLKKKFNERRSELLKEFDDAISTRDNSLHDYFTLIRHPKGFKKNARSYIFNIGRSKPGVLGKYFQPLNNIDNKSNVLIQPTQTPERKNNGVCA